MTIIALSDPESRDLAKATVDTLPAEADVRLWGSNLSFSDAVIELLTRSIRLAGKRGSDAGIDVARPRVPEFGRRLYHLPLRGRVPERKASGIVRKLVAAGIEDSPDTRAQFVELGNTWARSLREQRFAGVVLDYDGTVCWTKQRWSPPSNEIRAALVRALDAGLCLGFASGRGRSLYSSLRDAIPESSWDRVIVGMYNGAVSVRLDDELADIAEPTEWSASVVSALRGMELELEERGRQVSIAASGAVLAARLQSRLGECGVDARVSASGHSIDIVESETAKTTIADELELLCGGTILSIGDQGQEGGNDHALLARNSWTLTVDRCSGDPTSCWFVGSGDAHGPDLLLKYLRSLRRRRNGAALIGLSVQ